MLSLVHTLLLWSDHTRRSANRPSRFSLTLLFFSIVLWAFTNQAGNHAIQQGFCVILAIGYAWLQRSLWPLVLIPLTLPVSLTTQGYIDGLLQVLHAASIGVLLQTSVIDSTVQWQGVSVHVGPSCVNLLMFQGAAAIGWLAVREPSLREYINTVGLLIGFAGVLNFVRILCLTLLAPLAPNEDAWFLIHDGVSVSASLILVGYIWRRLKYPSTTIAKIKPAQTNNQ